MEKLGAGMVAAPMLLIGMFPILGQAIREWNFIGSGGTIIRKEISPPGSPGQYNAGDETL